MASEIAGLADIVRIHGREQPEVATIVYGGRSTSLAANALIAQGIGPQAHVAHLDESSDVFFELMFGEAKANAAMIPVSWLLAPPEVRQVN